MEMNEGYTERCYDCNRVMTFETGMYETRTGE